jgi:iron(III) transport system substrate-binding protein
VGPFFKVDAWDEIQNGRVERMRAEVSAVSAGAKHIAQPFSPRWLIRAAHLSAVAAGLFGAMMTIAAAEPLRERFKDLYKAASEEGQVVFYTDGRQENAQRISAFWKENFPDVRLAITPIGSPALIAQVETEHAAGQHRVDVTHMSQLYVAEIWKQKGLYQPYKTTTIGHYLPNYADPDGAFYSPELYVLPAAFNTKAITDRNLLPKNLADFLDPKWKGKIVLPDPVSSGNTLTFLNTMLAKGLIDWPYLEKLAKQDILFVRGNPDAVRMLSSGERVVAPILSSFNLMSAKAKGQPIDMHVLQEGAIIIESAMGIMANAPHPNAAKLLMEALMSPEGQAVLMEGGMFWPADSSVKLEGGIPPIGDMHPIIPPPTNQEQVSAFITRFKQVFNRH